MTEKQLKARNRKIKAGIARRLNLKTQLRAEIKAQVEGQMEEKIQRARDAGYESGYQNGVKDAGKSLRQDSFHDLHMAWTQVQRAHQDAANYAGIVASMYGARVKKEEK